MFPPLFVCLFVCFFYRQASFIVNLLVALICGKYFALVKKDKKVNKCL